MRNSPILFVLAIWSCGHVAARASDVTFNRDVSPILYAKCASCHRPGEAAPFSLLSYEDARRRAKQMVEVTQKRFMPPWPPHAGVGDFVGERRLTDDELKTLAAWAAAGAPQGDAADLPPVPDFGDGWQLGKPDLELAIPTFELAAAGSDRFRNFVLPVNLEGPRWVESIELRPTNPRAVHHARLGIDTSYESVRRDAADAEPGYEGMAFGADPDGQLVTWVPGMTPHPGLAGSAWLLRPRTHLVLHTHLQPTGKQEEIGFRVGIHFANAPPTVRPVILRVGSRDIDIPAGEASHKVVDEFALPVDVDVHSIFPHAHSLCKEVRATAKLPDGAARPLLWIEHFDENWHDQYRYVEPVRLPRGTKLVTEFSYDNTDGSLRNRHHPPERTVYGSNAADEMQDVYLQVTPVHADQRAALLEEYEAAENRSKLVGYHKTLELYPQDPWSREGLAACYLALGEPHEAVRQMEDRIELGAPEVHTTAILGMAQLADRDPAAAEASERMALAMDAEYPLAWFGLGKALVAQDQFSAADEAFSRALELAPELSDAALARADLFLNQGKLAEAASACESAIEASPDSANALLKFAAIRCRQRQFKESMKLLKRAHKLAPYTHPPKVLLAVYCLNVDRDRARVLLNEAENEQPDHPVPQLFQAQLDRQEGEFESARRRLDKATQKPLPENWPASHRKRFLVLLQAERLKLAEQLQDEALARDAIDQWLKVEPENEQLRRLREQLDTAAQR
ncbi:MAG: tetratricopeptide repeat protein [Pirellulales bacterium]